MEVHTSVPSEEKLPLLSCTGAVVNSQPTSKFSLFGTLCSWISFLLPCSPLPNNFLFILPQLEGNISPNWPFLQDMVCEFEITPFICIANEQPNYEKLLNWIWSFMEVVCIKSHFSDLANQEDGLVQVQVFPHFRNCNYLFSNNLIQAAHALGITPLAGSDHCRQGSRTGHSHACDLCRICLLSWVLSPHWVWSLLLMPAARRDRCNWCCNISLFGCALLLCPCGDLLTHLHGFICV